MLSGDESFFGVHDTGRQILISELIIASWPGETETGVRSDSADVLTVRNALQRPDDTLKVLTIAKVVTTIRKEKMDRMG